MHKIEGIIQFSPRRLQYAVLHRTNRSDSPFLTALFRLPNELHIAILSKLCLSDLLALRKTSRALHDLISLCGPSLVRFWVKCRLGTLHVKLYPPPGSDEADLQYLLAM